MSSAGDSEPLRLTTRAARIVASASRQGLSVTLAFVGDSEVVHGRVSFAHGARVVVRPREPAVQTLSDCTGRRIVMSLLVDGRAHALTGQVREVAERGVSIDLRGDLLGADPRRSDRHALDGPMQLMVAFGEHASPADVVDACSLGLGLRLSMDGPLPTVDGTLSLMRLGAEDEREAVTARVRHCTMAPDGHEDVIVGVEMPVGTAAQGLLDNALDVDG